MNAAAVKTSTSATTGALPASDSSFTSNPAQYDNILSIGGIGPGTTVHALWDLGSSVAVSQISAWSYNLCTGYSSVDGTTWTTLGTVTSSGLMLTGSARYLQFYSTGVGSQIYETQVKDGSGTVIAGPVPVPAPPAAPTQSDCTTSSIKVILPSIPVNATSLTLMRATNTGSGWSAFSSLASGLTVGGTTYTDGSATAGNLYQYACIAVGAGGSSDLISGTPSLQTTDFSFSCSPVTVQQNRSVSVPITVTPLHGFQGNVSGFSCSTAGVSASFAPLSVSLSDTQPHTLTLTLSATAAPETTTLTLSATGNDGGTPVTHSFSCTLTVTAPSTPDKPTPPGIFYVTASSVYIVLPDVPPGAASLTLVVQPINADGSSAGAPNTRPSQPSYSLVLTTGLTAGQEYSVTVSAVGSGGTSVGDSLYFTTLSVAPEPDVPWLPPTHLNLGPRVPDGATGLAFLDIPQPVPAHAAGIIDFSQNSQNNATSRSVVLTYDNAPRTISRSVLSIRGNNALGTGAVNSFVAQTQVVAASPIHITSVEEDASGSWIPKLSRGIFYQALTIQDDPRSWLWLAGLRPGQKVLAAYSTEIDWKTVSLNISGFNGNSGIQTVRKRVSPGPASVQITNGPLAHLGGLRSLAGQEILAGVSALGTAGSLTWSTYSRINSPTGPQRIGSPLSIGTVSLTSLSSGQMLSAWTATPATSIVEVTGSVHAASDGFYTFSANVPGSLRLSLWGIPIIDRWYAGNTSDTVSVYLHAGWHSLTLSIAPTMAGAITFTVDALTAKSQGVVGSQVTSIDYVHGLVHLSGNWAQDLETSYVTPGDLPVRGYFDDLGTWHRLDLNPSAGRTYDAASPTSDWLAETCYVYIVPTLVCPLTDVNGNPLPTLNWIPITGYTASAVRWGTGPTSSNRFTSAPFGTSSTLGGSDIGTAIYDSAGAGSVSDPRRGYLSGVILGAITLTAGLPALETVKIHDTRKRGGGLSTDVHPENLSGGQKARAETHWDLSPWDGLDSLAGKVLVQIPSAYITGADGMVAWTEAEIEDLVRQTVSAGIEPMIEIV